MMTYEIIGKCPNCGKRRQIYVRLEDAVKFNITEMICQYCNSKIEKIEIYYRGN